MTCLLSARRVQIFPRGFCKPAAVRCRCQLGHSLSTLLLITLVTIPAMSPFVPEPATAWEDQACAGGCTEEQAVAADRCIVSCRQRSEWMYHGPGRMSRMAFARRLAGVQRAGLLPHGDESGEHCRRTGAAPPQSRHQHNGVARCRQSGTMISHCKTVLRRGLILYF